MKTRFTVTVDCADPDRLARFWAEALGYELQGPPAGFDSWWAYWKSRGLPDEENYDGNDVIVDPAGAGPRIWFHQVPEKKVVKNRLHFDLHASGLNYTSRVWDVPMDVRKSRVDAAVERLVRLGAKFLEVSDATVSDHYAVAMEDPEGNEFDIN